MSGRKKSFGSSCGAMAAWPIPAKDEHPADRTFLSRPQPISQDQDVNLKFLGERELERQGRFWTPPNGSPPYSRAKPQHTTNRPTIRARGRKLEENRRLRFSSGLRSPGRSADILIESLKKCSDEYPGSTKK